MCSCSLLYIVMSLLVDFSIFDCFIHKTHTHTYTQQNNIIECQINTGESIIKKGERKENRRDAIQPCNIIMSGAHGLDDCKTYEIQYYCAARCLVD